MKKLIFIFTIIFISACSQAQSRNDFYGTWTYQNFDDSVFNSKMVYTITATTFTSVYTYTFNISSSNPYFAPSPEITVWEIFSWENITNEDARTRRDYPDGFLIGLRAGLTNNVMQIYIHRDKYSLISVYENKGIINQDVYIKPFAQSDFYGTWKPYYAGDNSYAVKNDYNYDEYEESDYAFKEITISKDALDTIKQFGNPPPPPQKYDILSWNIIINDNEKTKNEYPAGFHINTSDKGKYYFYLNKNRKTLYLIYTGSLLFGRFYIKQ